MFEKPNLPEVITQEAVIESLNTKGIEDQEARDLLEKYVDQFHTEADAEAVSDPENPRASNRAKIKADIKIATLYAKTIRYKDQARESLEDAYWAASQNESTKDLIEEIDSLRKVLDL